MTLIKLVPFASEDYYQAKEIREKYLRIPLGIFFSAEDLELDRYAYHLVAYHHNQIIGCVLGIRENQKAKIRQMLVIPEYQKQGIGSLLLKEIETILSKLGVNFVYLHSRQESLGFYEKHGYIPTGEPFIEVGIYHQKVEKHLTSNVFS